MCIVPKGLLCGNGHGCLAVVGNTLIMNFISDVLLWMPYM